MRGSGSSSVDGVGTATKAADLAASVLLLFVAFALGIVGSLLVWLEADALTDSSEPRLLAMCAFEQGIIATDPVISLVVVLVATATVIYRRRQRLTTSPAAAIAVGSIIVVSAFAGWIAYTAA